MEEYVIPIRLGGAGNQIWQVIAGELYAMINNKICLITRESQNPHNLLKQEYAKTIFRKTKFIDYDGIPLQKYTIFPQVVGFEYWEPTNIIGNVVLSGYFQYYPIIEENKDFVRQYLYNGLCEFIMPPTQKVFLHIRRGDYVGNNSHPNCSEKYYKKSLKLFPNEVICIFSDDITWCRQSFLKEIPNIEFIEEPNELKAMGLMISCQGGAICSNSTFAWWGAWLGAHQAENIVTVPYAWYNSKDTSHLFPREWIIVRE